MEKAPLPNAIFAPTTHRSGKRFYLVNVQKNKPNQIVHCDKVESTIKNMYKKMFGTNGLSALEMKVNEIADDTFIIAVNESSSVGLRAVLTLPADSDVIDTFIVKSESSFLQPLIHDSRLDYPLLI